MTTLADLIPDIDVLVDLPDQELALTVLKLCAEHGGVGNRGVHPQVMHQWTIAPSDSGYTYPMERHDEVDLSLGEAWNWLTVQGLLIPQGGFHPSNDWMRLSRKARRMLDEGSFEDYSRGVAFPKMPTSSGNSRSCLARPSSRRFVYRGVQVFQSCRNSCA